MPNRDFFTSCGEYVNLRYIAMLRIHLFDSKSEEEERKRRRMPNRDFFTSRGAYVNLAI